MTPRINPFIRARKAGVPLIALPSYDPAATVAAAVKGLNGKAQNAPLFSWDCISGLTPIKGCEPAIRYLAELPDDAKAMLQAPTFASVLCQHLPVNEGEPGAVFAFNMQRFIDDPGVMQSLWNARDVFKACGIVLALVGCDAKLPAELKNDVPTFEETVPDEAEIGEVITDILACAEIPETAVDKAKVTDGLLGYLSRFGVEQALSLSLKLDHTGVDLNQLWRLKVAALKSTAGLEVTLPQENFSDLRGCDGTKELFSRYLNGRERPRSVLQLDEIEKMAAGGQGDLSGTSQAIIEQFLYWTEARRIKAALLVGVPGGGKSRTCTCTAGEARTPLLRASMSTVKGSLVGQSEQQMKNLLAAADAIGQPFLIGTCNAMDSLSPEMIARFRWIIFYDYPTSAEALDIWQYWIKKFSLPEQPIPPSRNWVGREIAACCESAWLFNCTLAEAAKSIVPVCIANSSKMETLRRSASGRFLSAARPGVYTVETTQPSTGRRIEQ